MVRILYAGYLAFALYLLYPMVQNTLAFGVVCAGSALAGGASGLSTTSASGVSGQANRCAPTTQAGVATGRTPEIH
ncbi:hypothetical protein BLA9940_00990 [Burkholderia aenigmatica]|uniref:Uncharacterized protein n=1 Tax=Burkholderia aenigmatica TaxID=2015348 RepID=A0ABY6XY14_9BURK|nr:MULTISPECIES: hypothetical protein [Burkholderia]AYQ38365.1 hypothetical protein CVS37_09800 [Burkholderia lata]MCA8294702.1 hypothetical protein [Burkholderia sp. AU30198]UKD13098.1 hypothetical protein L3V59_08635 [Burkholderia aenigmatica]VWC45190.1 hypothetical protein BLA9940_00990 [Burkholderia aenigmatica]VWC74656.1 hypothetical protein BLA18628_00786 [Burkholderia aenigmatica]